jgi:hypothetical protein
MRRTVVVALATGLSAIAAPARAGEVYLGLSVGAAGSGHDQAFDSRFDSNGHAALGVVFGGETHGFTIDLTMLGAGYSILTTPQPEDMAVMWLGADIGRRVWLGDRVALGASLGLHAAFIVPWTDDDMVPPDLMGSGESWTASARIEYALARQPPIAPNYKGPIKSLNASLVIEARRERMFLEFDTFRAEPTVTVITVGLRGGIGL